jgi:hypothetical protein
MARKEGIEKKDIVTVSNFQNLILLTVSRIFTPLRLADSKLSGRRLLVLV